MERRGIIRIVSTYEGIFKIENWADAFFQLMDDVYWENPIYLFDLDGTIAGISHRLHFIQNDNKDWDSFFKACVNDKPISNIVHLLNDLKNHTNCRIWIVSGRSSMIARETVDWLRDNNVPYDWLFMRAKEDHRPDYVLKELWLKKIPTYIQEKIVCVFEDRQSVVDMWRENGITCCQVAKGNF